MKLYSVACENDDIEEFETDSRAAMTYAKAQAKLGRKHIVINVMTDDGQYLDAIHIR